jgi:ATP-dependent protease ClpP protease subunit
VQQYKYKIGEKNMKKIKTLLAAMVLSLALLVTPTMAEEEQSHSHYLNSERAGKLSGLSYITPKGIYFQLYSGISVADYTRMEQDLIKLRDYTDIREVFITINSPGGDAFTGLSLADLIIRAQNDWGFTFNVQATGIVASAAIPVFAVCNNRSASPGTMFMVHETALWKWPGRETASDIHSQSALMKKLQKQYLTYLVDDSKLKMKEWTAMEKKTTWFTTEQACTFGIIDNGCAPEDFGHNTEDGQ